MNLRVFNNFSLREKNNKQRATIFSGTSVLWVQVRSLLASAPRRALQCLAPASGWACTAVTRSARRLQVTFVSSLDPTVRAHGARETRPRFASGRNQTVLRCTEPSPLPGKQPPPRSEAWGFPAPPLPPALRSGELRPGPVTRPHRKDRCPRYAARPGGRSGTAVPRSGGGGSAPRQDPLIGHAPNGSSPQGPQGSHAPPRSRATGRTRIGDGPQEPEAAAVTRPRAAQQVPSGGGTARARQEAPPPGRGAGLAAGATVGPGAEPVSAASPRPRPAGAGG